MRIVDITEDTRDGWRTIEATVEWERSRREPQRIHYSAPESHAHMVYRSPDPFLCSAVIAAAYEQEPRVVVDEPACRKLVEGLRQVLEIQHQSRQDFHLPSIEGPTTDGPRQPRRGESSAVMLSGGIDALATVQQNRRTHDRQDGEYFRHGIVVTRGFDHFEMQPGTPFWNNLETIAEDVDLELVPVQTNVRTLQPADHFFISYLLGPLLAGAGHFLAAGATRVSIGSSGDSDKATLVGTHPETDPLLSSGAVTVVHDLDTTTRIAKTRNVSEWPAVRGNVRVCHHPPVGEKINCGQCEKCVRTMLTLLALGRLEEMALFDPLDLTPEFVTEHVVLRRNTWSYYPEIADALHESGHFELEKAVRERLAEWQDDKPGLAEAIKRLDQRILGGRLRRAARRLR